MILRGTIIDFDTRKPIPSVSITEQSSEGRNTGRGVVGNQDGTFTFDAGSLNNLLLFSSVGYISMSVKVSQLEGSTTAVIEMVPNYGELSDVTVTAKKKKTDYLGLAAVLAILLVAAKSDPKKRKQISGIDLSKINPNTVLIIGAGILGFTLIKKLLVSLGISTGAGAEKVAKEVSNPNSPWKPAFYKSAPAGAKLLTVADATKMANDIESSFTIFQDNYNRVLGVFSQLKTKSQVSFLADIFQQKHKADLLSFLTDGGGVLPWDGLSDKHLQEITDLVKNLPDYYA